MKRELFRTTAFIRAARRHLKGRPQSCDAVEIALELLAEDAFDSRLRHTSSQEISKVCGLAVPDVICEFSSNSSNARALRRFCC